MSKNRWFQISGFAGIVAPVIAVSCIFVAIANYPLFVWTDNALSDLGVKEGLASLSFNSGLVIGGILALVFASGLVGLFFESKMGKFGAVLFSASSLFLTCIGLFNESYGSIHLFVSVAFFTLMPVSMLFLMSAFALREEQATALFTLAVGLIAALVWICHWAIGFGIGVAIPEILSGGTISTWTVVLGFRLIMRP